MNGTVSFVLSMVFNLSSSTAAQMNCPLHATPVELVIMTSLRMLMRWTCEKESDVPPKP